MAPGRGLARSPWRAAAGVVVAAGLAALGCGESPRRHGVVLVSIDCLNERQFEESLSLGRAPNLARLAADALVFRRAYAHAPWTTPSHMSMLSGLYPSQHGRNVPYGLMIRFRDGDDRVPQYRTLAERLADAGYESAGFVGAGSISAAFGLGQGFSVYHESSRSNPEQSDLPENLRRAKEWLRDRRTRPFFLFVHTYEMHYPLAVGRTPFWRALGYLDDRLGELFEFLREQGLYESSLIMLTGDHGSRMMHTDGKCCVHGAGHYEENLRVPLVVKLPGRSPTGRRDILVRHVDILPTVLDVVGLPTGSYDGPGASILTRLAKPAGGAPTTSYSAADGRCRSRQAIVDERYKYIYTPDRPEDRVLAASPLFFDNVCSGHPACADVPREEFYDLRADPFEEANLLRGTLSGEQAIALERLRSQLADYLNLSPAYRRRLTVGGGSPDQLDDKTREALRALGYIR